MEELIALGIHRMEHRLRSLAKPFYALGRTKLVGRMLIEKFSSFTLMKDGACLIKDASRCVGRSSCYTERF